MFLAHEEIIANQHTGDGTEKSRVADEPAENVAAVVGHQFPGLHGDSDKAGNQAAGSKTDAPRREIGKIVGGRDDVGGYVDVEGGHEQREHGDHNGERTAEAREDGDWIPQGLAEDDERGGSYGDADEG